MMHNSDNGNYSRREFLTSATSLAGASLLLTVPGISSAGGSLQSYTVKQVIDLIMKEVPGSPFATTVDHLRSGSADQQVTGIVTTMFPTLDVIERTAKAG